MIDFSFEVTTGVGDATLYDFYSFKMVFGLFCGLGYELYWYTFCERLKIMCSLLFCGGVLYKRQSNPVGLWCC